MNDDELAHYGILRKSGRYPWGSGENPYQRNKNFLAYVDDLRKKGLSEREIAEGLGISTTELRAAKSIAKNQLRADNIATAQRLKDAGYSNSAIAAEMGLAGESSVRALLDPGAKDRNDVLMSTSNVLKDAVAEKGYIDIGAGSEMYMGVSDTKLRAAVAMLQEEGYTVHYLRVEQLGTGKDTTVKVLAPPDTPYSEVYANRDKIGLVNHYSEDGGRTYLGIEKPVDVSSKRIDINYGPDGGADADGVIYIRRGVDDISLGNANYAQVRISVDGTHYIKGMAMYKDDMPDGVDILFNTNKTSTGNKKDALKPLKDDEDNPFGSVVRQRHYIDKDGNKQLSAMNIVYEEGDWGKWSKTVSSQVLSKQQTNVAKQQLDLAYDAKRAQYDEIMSLTNPAVKKRLLESFADDMDSSAVHLKAAAFPRQSTHVILPINDLRENEIYAPNYRNGEKVALIRFPHGGIFEIPELTVNNRNPKAKSVLGQAMDAVGINSKVAQRLSGADFDGDTVLVIPNNNKRIKSAPPLAGLKNFDPQRAYPGYEGMKRMSERTKQLEMGKVSNLITDMTIRGATNAEIAAAVRHSMVVIDAAKHGLNYKASYEANGIANLQKKYQTKYQTTSKPGASTLISRASAEIRVPERKARTASKGGPIDPATGRKMYEPTGRTYVDSKGKTRPNKTKTTRMAEAEDARSLSSGTPMENVYATHANRLKALANTARKTAWGSPSIQRSPSAAKTYAREVASLTSKLNVALKNAPLERRAQLLANGVVSAKKRANPDMDGADVKKIKSQALAEARSRTGAKKTRVDITPREWEAIQAGAISNNRLSKILDNADLDQIKKYATPRTNKGLSTAAIARARSMQNLGYTQSEIADALGVSATTINRELKG